MLAACSLKITLVRGQGVRGIPARQPGRAVRRRIRAPCYPQPAQEVAALGLLIALCASADAATVRRIGHLRVRQHVVVRPSQGVSAPACFAVPGCTDEQTQYWLDC